MVKFIQPKPGLTNMSAKERMQTAKRDLDALKAKCNEPSAQIVVIRDELYSTLMLNALARKRRIPPMAMGFHPRNRGHVGIVAGDTRTKLVRFVGGFSPAECDRAVAVQRSPGDRGDAFEAKNIQMSKDSNGVLAPVSPGSLEAFSLTCTHTYGALRT